MPVPEHQSPEPELHLYGGAGLLADLKQNHLPMTVWQTMASPWFSPLPEKPDAATVTEEQWQQALRQRYEALPAHLQGAVQFPWFARQMEEKRPHIEADMIAHIVPETAPEGLDEVRHKSVSVMRLLTSPVNALGWQSLGAAGTGICVSLRTNHTLFRPEPGYPKQLQPVDYVVHRTTRSTREKPFPGWIEEPQAFAALAEWRLVIPKNRLRKPNPETDGAAFTLDLPAGAVSRITLGPLANTATRDALFNLRRHYQRYRSVPLSCVQPAAQTFRLHLVSLDKNS